MTLKELIVEAIARMYSTTVSEVSADIIAMPMAKLSLDQFCDAMEEAGY
jgi:hypothetical protein